MEPNWRDMEPNWRRQDWAAGPFFQEDLTSNEVESLEMSGDPRWIFLLSSVFVKDEIRKKTRANPIYHTLLVGKIQ